MEAEALRAVQSAFRRHGAKLTQQRLVILEEAARRRDHPSAEDIFRHVSKLSTTGIGEAAARDRLETRHGG